MGAQGGWSLARSRAEESSAQQPGRAGTWSPFCDLRKQHSTRGGDAKPLCGPPQTVKLGCADDTERGEFLNEEGVVRGCTGDEEWQGLEGGKEGARAREREG